MCWIYVVGCGKLETLQTENGTLNFLSNTAQDVLNQVPNMATMTQSTTGVNLSKNEGAK